MGTIPSNGGIVCSTLCSWEDSFASSVSAILSVSANTSIFIVSIGKFLLEHII